MKPGKNNIYSEADLVQYLKEHSADAFVYLYNRYSGALYAVILSIVANHETANDVLQEVFVKIWRQIALYDNDKGKLFTWMLNISRNTSIDMVRSKAFNNHKRNREITENVYDMPGIAAAVDLIGIRKIVGKLKTEYKILIELSYFEGFTQEEISKILDMPLGTVKTRMRNALALLREIIKE